MFLSCLFHGFWTQDDTGVSMFVSFLCGVSSASWDQTDGRWHEYLHMSGNIQCQTVRFKYICPLSIFVHPLWIAVNIKPRGEGCTVILMHQVNFGMFQWSGPHQTLVPGPRIILPMNWSPWRFWHGNVQPRGHMTGWVWAGDQHFCVPGLGKCLDVLGYFVCPKLSTYSCLDMEKERGTVSWKGQCKNGHFPVWEIHVKPAYFVRYS